MSGLDELTRDELIRLALELHQTVEAQAERIAELEAEIARLRGGRSSGALSVKPSVVRKEKAKRKEERPWQKVRPKPLKRFQHLPI